MEKENVVKKICLQFETEHLKNYLDNSKPSTHLGAIKKVPKADNEKNEDEVFRRKSSQTDIVDIINLAKYRQSLQKEFNEGTAKMKEDNYIDESEDELKDNEDSDRGGYVYQNVSNAEIPELSYEDFDIVNIYDEPPKEYDDVFQFPPLPNIPPGKYIKKVKVIGPKSNDQEKAKSEISLQNSLPPNKRLEYIMKEIIQTETKYIADMTKLVQNYKPYIEDTSPERLQQSIQYLFGNIEEIYFRQILFFEAIKTATDIHQLINCFIEHKSLFEKFPRYCINRFRAEKEIKNFTCIIEECKKLYNDTLDFSVYLLAPLTRFSKYVLFLKDILQQFKKLQWPLEKVQEALNIVESEMCKGNDAIAIKSIERSPIYNDDYGHFKMRDNFTLCNQNKREVVVFLFEKVIVFTETNIIDRNSFQYLYCIQMDDLRMEAHKDNTIHLIDFTKNTEHSNSLEHKYILDAKTEAVWYTWKNTINQMLWKQLNDAKENVLPVQRTRLQHSKSNLSRRENILKLIKNPAIRDTNERKTTKDADLAIISAILQSIENAPADLKNCGPLRKKEKFKIIKPINIESVVFLFQNIIVFTLEYTDIADNFLYHYSIKLIDLVMSTHDDYTMNLLDFHKSKKRENLAKYEYVLQATTKEICKAWKDELGRILWGQFYEVKANNLQIPPPIPRRPNNKNETLVEDEDYQNIEISEKLNTSPEVSVEKEKSKQEKHLNELSKLSTLETFGSLTLFDDFKILEPITAEVKVYLFTNVLCITSKNEEEVVNMQYVKSIKIPDLMVLILNDNKIRLEDLSDVDASKNLPSTYLLEAKTENVWKSWKQVFEDVVYDRIDQIISSDVGAQVDHAEKPIKNPMPLPRYKKSDDVDNIMIESSPKALPPRLPERTRQSMIDTTVNKEETPVPPLPVKIKTKPESTSEDLSTPPPLPVKTKLKPNIHQDSEVTDTDGNSFQKILEILNTIKDNKVTERECGAFKMQQKFSMIKPVKVESMVYLFEHVIILTTVKVKQNASIFFVNIGTQPEVEYSYMESIKLTDLRIGNLPDDKFELIDFKKTKATYDSPQYTFVLKANLKEVAQKWVTEIEALLWNQLQKVKENAVKSRKLADTHKKVNEKSTKTDNIGDGIIKSIKNSVISKKEYGSFKMKERFQILEPINAESMVILFENVIIFTLMDTESSTYSYLSGIKLDRLEIEVLENLIIYVYNSPKGKNRSKPVNCSYKLQAQTAKIWEKWRDTIRQMLVEKK